MKLNTTIAAILITPLISFGIASSLSGEALIVTSDESPATYTPLNQESATVVLNVLNQPKHRLTTKSLLSGSAVAHGARVRGGPSTVTTVTPVSASPMITPQMATLAAPATLTPAQTRVGATTSLAAPVAFNIIRINSCQTITQPGTYVLTADLSTSGVCLTFNGLQNAANNVSGVTIECDGHTVTSTNETAIAVIKSNNIAFNGCNLTKEPSIDYAFKVFDSQNISVTNSTIDRAYVYNLQGGEFTQNHYIGPHVQFKSSNILLADNRIDSIGPTVEAAGFYLDGGNHNQLLRNYVDGGYNGDLNTWGKQGADDGILLINEDADVVQNNTLINLWDAGFEGAGMVSNTLIEGNVIQNAGFAGIGHYYATNWTNNIVRGNRISRAPQMLNFSYSASDAVTASQYSFVNNLFENNSFSNPVTNPGRILVPSVDINLIYPANLNATLGNNIFRNNSFGNQSPGPRINPKSAFVDGGGNSCGSSTSINCNGRPNGLVATSLSIQDVPEQVTTSSFLPPPPLTLPVIPSGY